MTLRPHFIEEPLDPNSQEFRADCMAWELFTKKLEKEREAFIAGNAPLQTEDFRNRIRRCAAWYMLTYLNRQQIETDLLGMQKSEATELRRHLELMRGEIKKARQRKFKTYMGLSEHA